MGANQRYVYDAPPSYQPRHVWLRTSERAPIWPGVLVEWRRTDGQWQGRVAYASREGHAGDGWFTPDQIRPAPTESLGHAEGTADSGSAENLR